MSRSILPCAAAFVAAVCLSGCSNEAPPAKIVIDPSLAPPPATAASSSGASGIPSSGGGAKKKRPDPVGSVTPIIPR